MAFSGFQNSAFQRNAFQIVDNFVPLPLGLKGAGHYRKHNKTFRQTVKESLQELLDDPVAVEQVKEIVQPYSNSKQLTASSIDFKLLTRNVETAQRIIALAQEMQQERDDEIAIMLLM